VTTVHCLVSTCAVASKGVAVKRLSYTFPPRYTPYNKKRVVVEQNEEVLNSNTIEGGREV
jgi:hypothetical protein